MKVTPKRGVRMRGSGRGQISPNTLRYRLLFMALMLTADKSLNRLSFF